MKRKQRMRCIYHPWRLKRRLAHQWFKMFICWDRPVGNFCGLLCIIILANRFLVVSYTFFILHVYPALYAKYVNCPRHDNRVISSVDLWNICHPISSDNDVCLHVFPLMLLASFNGKQFVSVFIIRLSS